MKILNILIILISATMFACSNDNVYENSNGLVVTFKELRSTDDITVHNPWRFRYNITDYSSVGGNSAGNPGNFYLYTSDSFSVEDTLTFTTKKAIKDAEKMSHRLSFLSEKYSEYKQIKIDKDSLQIVVDEQNKSLLNSANTVTGLQSKLDSTTIALQESDGINVKNIKLQADLQLAQEHLKLIQAKFKTVNKFKTSVKNLITPLNEE